MEPRQDVYVNTPQNLTLYGNVTWGETGLDMSKATPYKPSKDIFYLTYRGSIAHNMFVPKSDPNSIDDIDLMGFAYGEIDNYFGLTQWGSRGTKEFKEGVYDVVVYEIRKAIQLLLQGNPNIMSMLWVPAAYTLIRDDSAKLLIENRKMFVGKHVYPAFAGYANEQLKKMESRDPADLREYLAVTAELKYRGAHPNHKGEKFDDPLQAWAQAEGEARNVREFSTEKLLARLTHYHKKGENLGYMGEKRKQLVLEHGYDSKNAAHLIRLLRMCVEFMNTGEMQVQRIADRDELLAIKQGKWALSDVKKLAEELFIEARRARDNSELPEGPNTDGVRDMLVEILRKRFYELP